MIKLALVPVLLAIACVCAGIYGALSVLATKDAAWSLAIGLPAVLYTVMRKMEDGYDTKHGDWEYAVLDGPSKRVLARGRIDSCIECHQQHASTDYVTRAYMKAK